MVFGLLGLLVLTAPIVWKFSILGISMSFWWPVLSKAGQLIALLCTYLGQILLDFMKRL